MIRETIQDVVANITETCMNEDVYVTDEESIHLPNRGTIIGIIKDLRRVVFPGYIQYDAGIFSRQYVDTYL